MSQQYFLLNHAQRQCAQALAGERKQRIGHGRRQWWHTRLADTTGRPGAGHQMGLHQGCLRQPQHRVVGEVLLLHHPFMDVHLAVQGRRQSKHHRTFHLLGDDAGVDHGAAVHGADHPVHTHLTGQQRRLGHLSDDGAK